MEYRYEDNVINIHFLVYTALINYDFALFFCVFKILFEKENFLIHISYGIHLLDLIMVKEVYVFGVLIAFRKKTAAVIVYTALVILADLEEADDHHSFGAFFQQYYAACGQPFFYFHIYSLLL